MAKLSSDKATKLYTVDSILARKSEASHKRYPGLRFEEGNVEDFLGVYSCVYIQRAEDGKIVSPEKYNDLSWSTMISKIMFKIKLVRPPNTTTVGV